MDPDATALLQRLLSGRPVAALATLHGGEPAVSMVPFVLSPPQPHLLVHVSALATHTCDMLDHPRVSVLVTAEEDASVSPQALPRVSLVADAVLLERDSPAYVDARQRYLARFPDAVQTFALGDFSVFALRLRSARLIAGFGRAYGLAGESLRALLRAG
jgi:putative heme iron utilization protein